MYLATSGFWKSGFIHALTPTAPIRIDVNEDFLWGLFGQGQLIRFFNGHPLNFLLRVVLVARLSSRSKRIFSYP
jgi:hypothetical protein